MPAFSFTISTGCGDRKNLQPVKRMVNNLTMPFCPIPGKAALYMDLSPVRVTNTASWVRLRGIVCFGRRGLPTPGHVLGLWLVVLALAPTGCAALWAPEQQHWQALADQVTTHFGVSAATLRRTCGTRGQYNCATLELELCTFGNTRWLLAHELGHHLSGVCGETLASEMVANRWAVQVLQVWGDSERQAVQATVLHLLALQRLRGDQQAVGHAYCT